MFFLPPFLFSLYAFPQNTQTHTHSHTFIHALPSPGLPCSLSLCFRWCRCCGRLIEMRVGMTAPCISASLQSPALPSTSASGTAVVGTQSFLLCVVLLILVCLLLPWQIDCFSPHFSKALNPTCIFFSAFLFPSSSFLLFSLSRSSQNHSLSESPSLFLSLPLSPTIHLPCLVAPLFCFVILPSFVSSLLLYPLHPSSSPRPCKLSISTEKLLKKSKLLRLISVNWI